MLLLLWRPYYMLATRAISGESFAARDDMARRGLICFGDASAQYGGADMSCALRGV